MSHVHFGVSVSTQFVAFLEALHNVNVMTTKDLRVPYRDSTALSTEIGSDLAIFRLISGFISTNQCKSVYYIIWKL